MKVGIKAYDPAWAEMAQRESDRWMTALEGALLAVHHIGSTAVPGLAGKPIIDLLPEIAEGVDPDSLQERVHRMGYQWLGEYGLPRRRYCRRSDPTTGEHLFHVHCWPAGDPAVARHLAFRDALLADPLLKGAYEARKRHCASLHRGDHVAYGACKSAWIDTVEARALAHFAGRDGEVPR